MLLEIDASVSEQPGLLLVWNSVVLLRITTPPISSWVWYVHFNQHTWNHATVIIVTNFSNNIFAMHTVGKSYRSWGSSWVFMHFTNHYKKFQWKQSRQLAGGCQFLSSRLSGLIGCVGRTQCILVPELILCTWIKPNPRWYEYNILRIIQNLQRVKRVISEHILHKLTSTCEIALRWMPQNSQGW